jgi:hypothetical protein
MPEECHAAADGDAERALSLAVEDGSLVRCACAKAVTMRLGGEFSR